MARKSFSTRWTKHLSSPSEQEQLTKTILASQVALDRLAQLIEEDLKSLDQGEMSIKDFEDPAWSHKQAFRNGSRAYARSLLNLLSFQK